MLIILLKLNCKDQLCNTLLMYI